MKNEAIALRLDEYASQLENEAANLYRARAYRRAAEVVRSLDRPLKSLLEEQGTAGLEALPGIGTSLAFALEAVVRTGELRTLRRVDAHRAPDLQLTSLPGIGAQLAQRIEERIGVKSLEELEAAARAGRLAEVGIGPKRARGILEALAGRASLLGQPVANEPAVEELLALDEEYRRQVADGSLPTIRPRQCNEGNEKWLPVWRLERAGWRYRVLHSNTALAHRLGTTHDWVVLYFEDEERSGQRTVVTETRGELRGERVVRGREGECRRVAMAGSEKEPAA